MMTDAMRMQGTVLPGRNAGKKYPSVDIIIVAKATLPSHALSQYPPARDEARERAEALLGVLEDAVQVGALRAQVGKRQRQHHEAHAHDAPGYERAAGRRDLRQLARDGEHARPDARADHHADQPEQADPFSFVH